MRLWIVRPSVPGIPYNVTYSRVLEEVHPLVLMSLSNLQVDLVGQMDLDDLDDQCHQVVP